MLDDFHAARRSAGSRSSSLTITWLRDVQMVAWIWDKQEGCKYPTLYYFPPSKLKRNAKSFLAARRSGSLSCWEMTLQNPDLLKEGHCMAAGKTAQQCDCDGWKHTGPSRRWKVKLECGSCADNVQNVPKCIFGTEGCGVSSRNVLMA